MRRRLLNRWHRLRLRRWRRRSNLLRRWNDHKLLRRLLLLLQLLGWLCDRSQHDLLRLLLLNRLHYRRRRHNLWLSRLSRPGHHDLLLRRRRWLLLNLFHHRRCNDLTLLNRFSYGRRQNRLRLLLRLFDYDLVLHQLPHNGGRHDLRLLNLFDDRLRLLNLLNLLDHLASQYLLLLLLCLDLLHHRSGQQLMRAALSRDLRQLVRLERRENHDLVLLLATGAEPFRRCYDHNLLLLLAAGADRFRRRQHHDLLRMELLIGQLLLLLLLLGSLWRSNHKLLGRFDHRLRLLWARWLRFQDRLGWRFGALLEQGLWDLDRRRSAGRGLLRG